MPNVGGKKYPYTARGKAMARKAAMAKRPVKRAMRKRK
jgi:hypothetical protein